MRYNADQIRHKDWPLKRWDGAWFAARPTSYGSLWMNIRDAWAVLTGRADALFWTNQ